MVLGNGVLHADDISFYPDTGVVFSTVEHQHGLLGKLTRTMIRIKGDGYLGCLSGAYRLFGELCRGAPTPGIHIVDGNGLVAFVCKDKRMTDLPVFFLDGSEVVNTFVVLERFQINRFLSVA